MGSCSPGFPLPNNNPNSVSPEHAGIRDQVPTPQNPQVRPFTRKPLCLNISSAALIFVLTTRPNEHVL